MSKKEQRCVGIDSFINDKSIMKSIIEKGLSTSCGVDVIKVYIKAKNILQEVHKDEKWLLFIFLNDEKTRKLISKAKAEEENTSPAFNIDCNTEARYLQQYKELTVLLYSAKISDKDQFSSFVVNKPALAWGSARVNNLNCTFSSTVTLSRPTAEHIKKHKRNPVGCYLQESDIGIDSSSSFNCDSNHLANKGMEGLLESSVLNALRSSNQLENCSIFDRLPKVHDYNGIPDLVPYPDNDDDCFLPTELGKNSLSSVADRPNPPNEGTLLLSALNAYQLNKYDECIKDCEEVKRINQDNQQATTFMLYSYIELKQIRKAYNLFKLGVNTLEQLYLLATLYMKMGKLEKAHALWDYMVEHYHYDSHSKQKDCESLQESIRNGYRLFSNGKFLDAAEVFKRVYESCPHNFNVTIALLESILRCNNSGLFKKGMDIMKTLLFNAAHYLHDYKDEMSLKRTDSPSKKFDTSRIFAVTFELFDSSSHNMEPIINRDNNQLTFLFLRFLVYNNELKSYLLLASIVSNRANRPKGFDSYNRFISTIIDLDEEAEDLLSKKQLKEALGSYKLLLKTIEVAERMVVPISLNHKKTLIYHYSADICYYCNHFKEGIFYCNEELKYGPISAGLFSLRGRLYQRLNRLFYAYNDFYTCSKLFKEKDTNCKNCRTNLENAKAEYEVLKNQLMVYYSKASRLNYLEVLNLELSQIIADLICRFPFYPYFYAEQGFLAFIRCDIVSFISNMQKFASLMNLPSDDVPFPMNHESNLLLHPQGRQEGVWDRLRQPFSDEEAKHFSSFGSTDLEVSKYFAMLDKLNMDILKRTDFDPNDTISNRCNRISLLCMQQYYFYCTLLLIYAGDYERAKRFACYNDRLYQYIINQYPRDVQPTYLPPHVLGVLKSITEDLHVKMVKIQSLEDQEQYQSAIEQLLGFYGNIKYNWVFDNQILRDNVIPSTASQYNHLKYVEKESKTCILNVKGESKVCTVKQLPTHSVPPIYASREIIIHLLKDYLFSKEYQKGIAFIENIYYNLNAFIRDGKYNLSQRFSMHVPLLSRDLKTVYTCCHLDSEVFLYYVKFLVLSGRYIDAMRVVESLPSGMEKEPDFAIICGLIHLIILILNDTCNEGLILKIKDCIGTLAIDNEHSFDHIGYLMRILQPVSNMDKSDMMKVKAMIVEAEQYYCDKEYENALQVYSSLLFYHPFSVEIYAKMIHCCMHISSISLIITEAKNMIKSNIFIPDTYFILSTQYRKIGDLVLAQQYYEYYLTFLNMVNTESLPEPSFMIENTEEKYSHVMEILEGPCPEEAIPIIEDYLAMCPYSREAHIQLLYCYYKECDIINMKRILKKTMKNLDSVVTACIEQEMANDGKSIEIVASTLLTPSWCYLDENGREIEEDLEMFFYYIRVLLLESRISIIRQLLSVVKKHSEHYFTTVQIKYLTNRYNRDDGFSDITNLHNGIQVRSHTSDVCDYVTGEHLLNNSYRLYPSFIVLRSLLAIINDITIIEENEKKRTDSDPIGTLTALLQTVHTRFLFNDVFNFTYFRAMVLYQRASYKKELKENAASDIGEALKSNPSFIEGYLLKARIDYCSEKNLSESISSALKFYEMYISRAKPGPEYDQALKEYKEINSSVQYPPSI